MVRMQCVSLSPALPLCMFPDFKCACFAGYVWYLVSLLTSKSVFGRAHEANADMGVREHVEKVVQLEGTVD